MKTCRKKLHQYEGRQCPECLAPKKAAYAATEGQRQARKEWRIRNAEKIRAHKARKHLENKERNNARSSAWYYKNHGSERLKRGGAKWGISPEEYATRVTQPCGICGHIEKVKKMHVDHDHETGRLRGTLCHECNTGLGLFDDSTSRLLSAIQYLGRYA